MVNGKWMYALLRRKYAGLNSRKLQVTRGNKVMKPVLNFTM